ncbi:unnamed protein product [Owenia fusiformis]|uniref:Uncharacterized protein n=1 Tax=Owenia fusiformis TaxID=6347 RepID=A0A8J1TG77_OWEFU|nr:unnamed protein product [Owenia fusiformis]
MSDDSSSSSSSSGSGTEIDDYDDHRQREYNHKHSKKKKYFFITSRMNGLVLDVKNNGCDPGARLIMWERKSDEQVDNQMWWAHRPTRTIRSKLNGFCLDICDDRIVLNPYEKGRCEQIWLVRGEKIKNRNTSNCLDIVGANQDSGAEICSWEHNGQENQQWEFKRRNKDF